MKGDVCIVSLENPEYLLYAIVQSFFNLFKVLIDLMAGFFGLTANDWRQQAVTDKGHQFPSFALIAK